MSCFYPYSQCFEWKCVVCHVCILPCYYFPVISSYVIYSFLLLVCFLFLIYISFQWYKEVSLSSYSLSFFSAWYLSLTYICPLEVLFSFTLQLNTLNLDLSFFFFCFWVLLFIYLSIWVLQHWSVNQNRSKSVLNL